MPQPRHLTRHLPRQQVHLGGHSGKEQAQGAMGAPQECQVVSAGILPLACPRHVSLPSKAVSGLQLIPRHTGQVV